VSQKLGFSQLQVTAAWETAQQLNSTLRGAADADKVIRDILQKQMAAAGARDGTATRSRTPRLQLKS